MKNNNKMATAEKGSLLKNVKVKIKDKDTEEKEDIQLKFNVSEEAGKDKESSKFSKDNKKETEDNKKEESGKEENSNSKVIKENSEEMNNNPNSSKEEENSENKSEYNYKNTNEKEGENNLNGSGGSREAENNNNSSFLNSKRYNNLHNENENSDLELNDSNEEDINPYFIDRTKPFLTTGKFMQIQPHFNIFSQQVEDLHNSLYENTKKCLIYKSSLQQSENLIREQANSVVKDLVDKIFNLRQMFLNANRNISQTIKEVNQNVIKVTQIQARTRKEIHECDHRINNCEGQVGYKLLGKPNYSFMKRFCSTTTK